MKPYAIQADWFNFGARINSQPVCVQDTVHMGTKLRNAFLKTIRNKNRFPFGDKFFIQLEHVKYIMNNFPKDQHELTPMVINPEDRQNFASVLRMCDIKVVKMLNKYVAKSEATIAFLNMMRDVIDSYRDVGLKPLERVEKIWFAVFILRIWREYIISKDDLTLKDNFLSMNSYSCIEINAHSLIMLILHLNETNQPQLFKTHLYESQPCEIFFRQIRSYTTVYSTVVNCSVKEMLGRIKQIQLQNDIANRSGFNFPRIKVQTRMNEKNIIELPSEKQIIEQIEKCKQKAIDFAVEIKLMKKVNVKSFVFTCKIPSLEPKANEEGVVKEEKHLNIKLKTLNFKDFSDKFEGKKIPEDSMYVRVTCDNNKEFVIKKTSLCWLLREEQVKLSSDRLVRVKTSEQHNK